MPWWAKPRKKEHISGSDDHFDNNPVDLPMSVLFGKAPKMHRTATKLDTAGGDFAADSLDINDSVFRVLRHPAVASKVF